MEALVTSSDDTYDGGDCKAHQHQSENKVPFRSGVGLRLGIPGKGKQSNVADGRKKDHKYHPEAGSGGARRTRAAFRTARIPLEWVGD